MRILLRIVLTASLFAALPSFGATTSRTITIIDNQFRPLPLGAERAIRSLLGWGEDSGCNFIGRAFPLGQSGEMTLVATTSAACLWGAAQGPLFVLRQRRGKYVVLLHAVGYSISQRPAIREGKTVIRVAGQHSYADYRLEGKKYVEDSRHENS